MIRVAFQGELGAFSEAAAVRLWAGARELLPRRTFAQVIRAVETGEADAGVLPVENRIAGPVPGSLAALHEAAVIEVVGSVVLPIRLHLLSLPQADLARLTRIASHPIALIQCRAFLGRLPGVATVAWYDTAGAARDVAAARDPTFAAIAGLDAAERYGLALLACDVQDHPDNHTRFIWIRRCT